ncbi:MAG: GNAT family N-acetyltransferase [Anaerolineales bacterium]|nr:GNAT family N-acetyltransferase [Anaerolineales bacterium]
MTASSLPPYRLRPAALADLDAVTVLIGACNGLDYDEPVVPVERVRQVWQAPGFDLARHAWLAVDPAGRVVGYAHLLQPDPHGFDTAVYVDPALRTGGIETRLLAQIEAAAWAAVAAPDIPRFVTRVSDQNPAGRRALEGAGYRRWLTFQTMELVMGAPPAEPRWPPGLAVRRFVPGQDDQAAYQTDEEAGRDKGYHAPLTFEQWAKRMDLYGERFDPALWFLAWDGAKLAGVVLSFYVPAMAAGWVDHLSVRHAWRRRGLGQALLLQALAAFYDRGVRQVRLSVDAESLTQAPRLYERVGMRTIREYDIYVKASTGVG